jgi:hypothetical protein
VTTRRSSFALVDRLSAKADPALIAADERHFAKIERCLEQSIADVSEQLELRRRAPGGIGQAAMDRDQDIHRLSARLRVLRRYGVDLCLGRIVGAEHPEPVYVGRFGLTDPDGHRLLLDWRSPAAEPFFGATHANPMGLESRRRYRWTHRLVSDYWDEVFAAEGLEGHAALDDQSAFIASLGSARSTQMRDVLGTIQADQDAIIRAGSRGALVVDGGPGTGKTVVALHRAAYLLYSEPRIARGGGLLFVGPHSAYLSYIGDVLPSLGEEGVQTCTLRDLVDEGAEAAIETDTDAARLKADGRTLDAIEAAVRFYEQPPTERLVVETPWGDARLGPHDWAEAFDAAEPGTPHNEARDQVWEALLSIITDRIQDAGEERDYDGVEALDDGYDERGGDEFDAYGRSEEIPEAPLRRALSADRGLRRTLDRAWPLLEASGVVASLWQEPAFLRACAPWIGRDGAAALQRPDPRAWTVSDLPLIDAARRRIGDPAAARSRRRTAASVANERERMNAVVEQLIESDDSEMGVMQMLRGQDLRSALADESAVPVADPDRLAGPFAHIVVDEAQELTDAEWRMLIARCPSRSFTIVGDRAQARHGFTERWQERLERVGLERVEIARLTINYRTPEEVMAEAEVVIRHAIPDANVPTSIRASGMPVMHGSAGELSGILDAWTLEHQEGIAVVIGDPAFVPTARVRSLSPESVKGLEFDLVVIVDPQAFGESVEGAVDRYVAMTRATQRLVILTSP